MDEDTQGSAVELRFCGHLFVRFCFTGNVGWRYRRLYSRTCLLRPLLCTVCFARTVFTRFLQGCAVKPLLQPLFCTILFYKECWVEISLVV